MAARTPNAMLGSFSNVLTRSRTLTGTIHRTTITSGRCQSPEPGECHSTSFGRIVGHPEVVSNGPLGRSVDVPVVVAYCRMKNASRIAREDAVVGRISLVKLMLQLSLLGKTRDYGGDRVSGTSRLLTRAVL